MKLVKNKRKGEIVMKKSEGKKVAVKCERCQPLKVPKSFRRLERTAKNYKLDLNNKGQSKNSGFHSIGFRFWNPQAIHIPQRKKFKGWQRENRRYKKSA